MRFPTFIFQFIILNLALFITLALLRYDTGSMRSCNGGVSYASDIDALSKSLVASDFKLHITIKSSCNDR
jgi:hypothetical protein